jgi:hypothetical protein
MKDSINKLYTQSFFRSSDKQSDDESEGGAQQGTSWKGMHTLLQ